MFGFWVVDITVVQAVSNRWRKNEKMTDPGKDSCGCMGGDTQREGEIYQITRLLHNTPTEACWDTFSYSGSLPNIELVFFKLSGETLRIPIYTQVLKHWKSEKKKRCGFAQNTCPQLPINRSLTIWFQLLQPKCCAKAIKTNNFMDSNTSTHWLEVSQEIRQN